MKPERKIGSRKRLGVKALSVIAVCFASSAMAGAVAEKNSARFLWYKNCGRYVVHGVTVQMATKGRNGKKKWTTIDEQYDFKKSIDSNQGVCFDLQKLEQNTGNQYFNKDSEVRLKYSIAAGDRNITCDSTNVDLTDEGFTRQFRSRGGTHLNNGCKSVRYNDWQPTAKCRARGQKLTGLSC